MREELGVYVLEGVLLNDTLGTLLQQRERKIDFSHRRRRRRHAAALHHPGPRLRGVQVGY